MRPAKKDKSCGRVRAGALIGFAALAVMGAGAASAAQSQSREAALPPRGEVTFVGQVIGVGSKIHGSGDIIGYYTAPGCFIVQLSAWSTPAVVCGSGTTPIRIGARISVQGVVERTVRQRQGPFLDVVPFIRGTVSKQGE
jgi:hypothetical protein